MHQPLRGIPRILATLLALGLMGGAAAGQPLARDDVPSPLEPWVDWVLRGHERERCPSFHGAGDRRACVWPSRLELDLRDGEGRFVQEWLVSTESHVPLPGTARRWPQDVRADRAPVPVVSRDGVPAVRLSAGRHVLTGSFRWDRLPELLQIPPETGIVALTVRGREVALPNRDVKGRLWLRKKGDAAPAGAEQRLDVTVHRRVADEIPVELETRVKLDVAGRSREVVLGRALPDGFVPLALASALPARLDPDGRLRVQVRPGTWRITLRARHRGPVQALGLPEPGGPWDPSEVWVFDPRPQLRVVTVEDGVAVDPSQTTLPDEWRRLPAYLMEAGRTLRFVEKRRGDSDPAPDELRLSRTIWLDFDGRGYTVSDEMSGVIRRGSRLEMGPATRLGRVELNGRDALITRLDGSPLVGVEVPPGSLRLLADSRVEKNGAELPAVGWDHDVQSLSARLNLPPGWRLLHARGVDRVAATWLNRWTLLDLFAVLLLAAGFSRLWGVGWGAVALAALGLAWTEPRAPQWAWVAVLVAEALRRVIPRDRFPRAARGVALYRGVALGLLVLLAIPFGVAQVRAGLFPALEAPSGGYAPAGRFAGIDAVDEAQVAVEEVELRKERAKPAPSRRLAASSEFAQSAVAPLVVEPYEPDPMARITTGPGLPTWQWTPVQLTWSGPIESDQAVRLFLVPPLANGLLAFARVGLVSALLICTLGAWARGARGLLRPGGGGGAAAAALLAGLLALPGPAGADLPSPELLEELRQRLIANPECHPRCASSPRLVLEVMPATLRARIEIHAEAETAAPLPGNAGGWAPQRVIVDGEPADGLLRSVDGNLWVRLPPGRHQLVVDGSLPDRDSVELPLPLRARRVEVKLGPDAGWEVHGVHEDGIADGNIQLIRVRETGEDEARDRALEPGELPPFVRIERVIRLGLEWQVETRVTRISPDDTALVLQVPLLPGESVTTAGIRADGDRALVSMAPGVGGVVWRSLLSQSPELVLQADAELEASEVWRLDVSPVWHIEASGIPPVHQPSPLGARIREWRPWPGESVAVEVRRPAGVEGPTATIDASVLTLAPGLRSTDANLNVTLRSSQGGQHTFTLPEEALLQRVSIDGRERPIRQEGRQVSVPLRPGAQQIAMSWREPRGARTAVFRGSAVGLGMPSANGDVTITPSPARWTLFVGGPRLGPAVLFWPLLVVFAGVAFALGRLSQESDLTPLRFHHWLLLGVGLTQVPAPAAAFVVGWLLLLGWRHRRGTQIPGPWFNLFQIGLAGASGLALVVLFLSIRQGLLGLPEMQISGNGSSAGQLSWYQDRSGPELPQPWVFSVPILVYRLAMLAWALWLALALVRWLRWGWSCFSAGELWRPWRTRLAQGSSSPA